MSHGVAFAADRARPADEPLWQSIAEALIEPLRADAASFGQPSEAQLIEVRKVNAAPEMQAAMARATTEDLVEVIAERTGTDPKNDLYPQLAANVTIGTMNAVLSRYVNTAEPLAAMPALLRDAFAKISEGLPPPFSE